MIGDKYNVSPLIFDLVCYPFITKKEYYEKRLDIVSEEALTLFKEDLSVFKQHKKTDCHLSEKKVYLILRIRLHDTENLPLTWV